jgi:23S rRNA (cytidine1920-2'-O)/16S rRNA (cytidine1409-2'-O)-methyltransferase
MAKQRLDTLLAERGLFASRSRAAASVMAGEVRVGSGGRRAEKPGEMVAADVPVSVDERPRYVSRGGIKLENALARTGLAVAGRTALDVGSSTGGFTDCLLQQGAAAVIAVDVGYGELSHRLRTDPRVHVLERTNARALTPAMLAARGMLVETGILAERGMRAGGECLPASVAGERPPASAAVPDLAVVDVSFISLTKVLPAVLSCLAEPYDVLALVKPQFELGRERVGKGGVVRDPADRRAALVAVGLAAAGLGVAEIDGHAGLPAVSSDDPAGLPVALSDDPAGLPAAPSESPSGSAAPRGSAPIAASAHPPEARIHGPSGPPAVLGFCSSGLPGPKGNLETFVWLAEPTRAGAAGSAEEIERLALREEP